MSCETCLYFKRRRVSLFARAMNWCRLYKCVPVAKCINWKAK